MRLAIFFGCTFIAFGLALGLFLFTIARDPLLIIILIAGSVLHRCRAFFWLVSLLLSSLIWFIAVKASDPQDELLQRGLLIFGVMFSVLLQKAFRFLYYKLLSGSGWSPQQVLRFSDGEVTRMVQSETLAPTYSVLVLHCDPGGS
ncbi:gamma-secretase subunit aph-1b-like [Limosa lapponica baueri]|uniref:Gamma-secretase subunit APH-1 n=1 Tax=Limosa lapponica baueri TaxID=1758121 RepID=A0A2I0TTL9_LIMLA|nr:gamma-secretase subunit aph-1b-like [Limosa lapponica baueri]